jgi:hypothetical protein
LTQIEAAFGPRTEIVTIEATEAAKAQGAIHCLTLTAPFGLSIFSDTADVARRTESLARKDQLDRNVAAEIASQIPTSGLQGSWAILEEGEQTDETPLDLYPQEIYFGEHEFQKGVFHQLESKGTYIIDKRDSTSWSLHFLFPDQDVAPAVVHWLSKDEVKLVLRDTDSRLVLRRIGSETSSPFKAEQQTSQQSSGGSWTKHPARKKPTPGTGQPPVALQPVQP